MTTAPKEKSNIFFFFNDTATTEIYTLSLHDALPICHFFSISPKLYSIVIIFLFIVIYILFPMNGQIYMFIFRDRKSTRLNSSHANISYAVFCLKKKISLHSHLLCQLCP